MRAKAKNLAAEMLAEGAAFRWPPLAHIMREGSGFGGHAFENRDVEA